MRSYRGVFFALFTAAARPARLFSPYYDPVAFLLRIITIALRNNSGIRFSLAMWLNRESSFNLLKCIIILPYVIRSYRHRNRNYDRIETEASRLTVRYIN